MSILLDTSVLVAAMVESHPDTGIIGGATYDALILCAAAKAHADQVVKLNTKDFQRVYPDLAEMIVSP